MSVRSFNFQVQNIIVLISNGKLIIYFQYELTHNDTTKVIETIKILTNKNL